MQVYVLEVVFAIEALMFMYLFKFSREHVNSFAFQIGLQIDAILIYTIFIYRSFFFFGDSLIF